MKPPVSGATVAVVVAAGVVTAAVTGCPDAVLTDPDTCDCWVAGPGVAAAGG